MFVVYILWSPSNAKFYIGQTSNLDRRIHEHNAGQSNSTKSGRPWSLVYCENYKTRSDSVKRERQIKSWKDTDAIKQLISADSDW